MTTEYSYDNTVRVPTQELLTLAQRTSMTMLFIITEVPLTTAAGVVKTNMARDNLPWADQTRRRLLDAHT